MQYEVEANGRVRRVTVHRAAGTFVVDVDGRARTVSAERIDGYTLSLLIEDVRLKPDATLSDAASVPVGSGFSRTSSVSRICSYEVTVAPDGDSGQLRVSVGSRTVAVSLNGRRRWGRRAHGADAGGGPERIVAPMPGKIVRVLVAQGAAVRAHQAVVVVEAMKMENELRAGRDGIVTEVHVQDGQSVEAGGLLVVIAAAHAE